MASKELSWEKLLELRRIQQSVIQALSRRHGLEAQLGKDQNPIRIHFKLRQFRGQANRGNSPNR